tara:strand:- start:1099 stop:1407 length:309 start_codon:yes stop_codon:yes gene_type:complete
MNEQCPRCQSIGQMIDVHGHYQCSICGSIVEDCCNGETCSPKKQKTYFLRVRADYVGYFQIEADTLSEAEKKATEKFNLEMNDEIDGSFDIEEYQPEEDNYL